MLNNEFPPLGGGTGTVNQAMLYHFAKASELQIDLVTSALRTEAQEETFSANTKIYKVPVRNENLHHASNRELATYAFRGFFLASKLHRKHAYDLCFAWSAVPAGAIALSLRRLTGLRYVVRVCGPDIPGFERRYRTLYPILSPLIRIIWHGAEQVVAKSATELEMIRAIDGKAKCSVVANGVNLAAFTPGDPVPDSGPLRLLCVGRLIERKGQHFLIEAVKRLADEGIDVILDLVGTGDARAANEAHVERLGLKDRIRFLGYVPRDEIARWYAAAHVFVLPSYNEGMSVALLEAMAAGLPVIVTPTGGTAELVEPGVNGFIFEWGDMDALTRQVRFLAQDRSLVRRMGAASRARAARFTWQAAGDRYLDMFKQIIAVPSTSAPGLKVEAERKLS